MAIFKRTTGPVSSCLGLNNIRVVALNNTSVNRKVRICLFNLSLNPKRTVWDRTITLKPFSSATTDTPASNLSKWEVQSQSDSKNVRLWVGGRDDAGMNLDGNTVLSSEFKRIQT